MLSKPVEYAGPFVITNPDRGDSNTEEDWGRDARGERVFINDKPLSEYAKEYGFLVDAGVPTPHEPILGFFKEVILKDMVCDDTKKDEMVEYLFKAFHQGGLMMPVAGPLTVWMVKGPVGIIPADSKLKQEIRITTTPNGFKVKEICTVDEVILGDDTQLLYRQFAEQNPKFDSRIAPEPDSYVVKAEGVIDVNFSDNTVPKITAEENRLLVGASPVTTYIERRLNNIPPPDLILAKENEFALFILMQKIKSAGRTVTTKQFVAVINDLPSKNFQQALDTMATIHEVAKVTATERFQLAEEHVQAPVPELDNFIQTLNAIRANSQSKNTHIQALQRQEQTEPGFWKRNIAALATGFTGLAAGAGALASVPFVPVMTVAFGVALNPLVAPIALAVVGAIALAVAIVAAVKLVRNEWRHAAEKDAKRQQIRTEQQAVDGGISRLIEMEVRPAREQGLHAGPADSPLAVNTAVEPGVDTAAEPDSPTSSVRSASSASSASTDTQGSDSSRETVLRVPASPGRAHRDVVAAPTKVSESSLFVASRSISGTPELSKAPMDAAEVDNRTRSRT